MSFGTEASQRVDRSRMDQNSLTTQSNDMLDEEELELMAVMQMSIEEQGLQPESLIEARGRA